MTRLLDRPQARISADLESAEVWPVRVEILDAKGVTLWSGGESDLLLAADHRVLLFGSTGQLRHFVLSGARTNLDERPGYADVRRYLRGNSDKRLRIDGRDFSLNATVSILLDGRITNANQTQVLDSLNLLWDIANTVDHSRARRVMREAKVRWLLDELTFSALGPDGQLTRSDVAQVGTKVEHVMHLVRPQIDVLAPSGLSYSLAG